MESGFPVKAPVRTLLSLWLAVTPAAVALAQTERINLPDMGNSAENFLSDGEEEQYAQAILMQMRAYEVLVDDPLIAAYFNDMGYRLVAASDKPEQPFTFVILDEKRVNAFAAPGGVVALHSGLILQADDEHEVAGVLAHEVAHITQLHLYRTLENTQRMTIPIALGMLAIALAGGGSGDAITGALMTAQGLQAQAHINFTRDNEVEADRIGIQTLSAAGYDPIGMAEFFEKMGRISRAAGKGPPEFLRTHPVSVNRIAEAKDRAASMPVPEPNDMLNFYLAQARLRALLEDQPKDAVGYFRDRITDAEDETRLMADQYGLSIALTRQREFEEARRLVSRLMEQQPGHLAFQLQIAAIDKDSGRVDDAIQRLGDLHHAFPGNPAITIPYAEALLLERDPDHARMAGKALREHIIQKTDDPKIYELYARASNIAGQDVRASEAMAEAYFRRGGISEAMEQLEMLTRRDDLDYYQRARVTARLQEMRIMAGELGEENEEAG